MTTASDTVIALPHRAVARVAGEGAEAFLERLVTFCAAKTAPERPAYGALLTPQGKVLAELFAFRDADGVYWLDAPAEGFDDLLAALKRYRLRAKIEIAAAPELAPVWSPRADGVSQTLSGADPRGSGFGARGLAPAGAGGAGGAGAEDAAALAAARITLGAPTQGLDYGPSEVFASDVNIDLLNGVDFAKGCFVGQEVASRMKRKAQARRRTLIARFEGAAPDFGATLEVDGLEAGRILSAMEGAALALVRVDRLEAAAGRATLADGRSVQLAFPDYFPPEARAWGAENASAAGANHSGG